MSPVVFWSGAIVFSVDPIDGCLCTTNCFVARCSASHSGKTGKIEGKTDARRRRFRLFALDVMYLTVHDPAGRYRHACWSSLVRRHASKNTAALPYLMPE